jgi:hypothetical protein
MSPKKRKRMSVKKAFSLVRDERFSRWTLLFLICTTLTIFFTLVSYVVIGLLAGEKFGLKDSLR